MRSRLAVVTRMHYPEDSVKFGFRLEYYAQHTLKSLLEQTDQDFDVWIWCEPWHDEIVKNIHPRINIFHGNWRKRDNGDSTNRYFIDYTHWKDIIGLPKYEIQVGLDSDDMLAPQAIEVIKKHCTGKQRTAISLLPLKLDLATGKRYSMRDYKAQRCSPIFALYQPGSLKDDFMFAYQSSHMRLAAYCDKKIELPTGLAFMGIGDHNESTKIKPEDKPV